MRSLLLLILTLAASAFLPAAASAQECLSSAAAVRAAHGQSAWSDWHIVNGRKCYSLGVRPDVRRSDIHRAMAGDSRHGADDSPRVRRVTAPAPVVPAKVKTAAPEALAFAEPPMVAEPAVAVEITQPPPVGTPFCIGDKTHCDASVREAVARYAAVNFGRFALRAAAEIREARR